MFQKILVGLDRSAIGQLVFEQSIALASATHASLRLLHVLSVEDPNYPIMEWVNYYPSLDEAVFAEYMRQREACKQQGLEFLKARAAEATAAGVTAEIVQMQGDPGRAICEQARTCNADLIVVGRRGRAGLSELLLGSVSNYVLHHALCSVLTVQSPTPTDAAAVPANQAELVS